MNNSGQSIITMFFWVLVFLIGFAMFFGGWVNDTMEQAINDQNLTGVEAFILANFNVFIIIALVIFILAYLYMAGGGG